MQQNFIQLFMIVKNDRKDLEEEAKKTTLRY